MRLQPILPAILFLALGAAAVGTSQAAPLAIATSKFSITFPDGWTQLSLPGVPSNPQSDNDSTKQIMNMDLGAFGQLLLRTSDHPPTAAELEAYMALYGTGTDLVKTGEGTKTLGSKAFTWVEYKSADSADQDTRVRFYYTVNGTRIFNAFMGYDLATQADAVASFEAGLATLNLPASAIRAVTARLRPEWRPADRDALGRSRPLALRTALFRIPAP